MTVGDIITLPHQGVYRPNLTNQQIADLMLDLYWSNRAAILRGDPEVKRAVDDEMDKLEAMLS